MFRNPAPNAPHDFRVINELQKRMGIIRELTPDETEQLVRDEETRIRGAQRASLSPDPQYDAEGRLVEDPRDTQIRELQAEMAAFRSMMAEQRKERIAMAQGQTTAPDPNEGARLSDLPTSATAQPEASGDNRRPKAKA
jgi:hypothetical protein